VALVRNASLPDQQVWLKTLATLAQELADHPDHPYASPLLTIVGPVARPDRVANWYEVLPRVWYTGTNADHYTRPCRLTHRPLITIEPLDDTGGLDARLKALTGYRWAVFTSRHTVAAVFARLAVLGLDARAFAGVSIASVGRATAADLESRGLRADLVASPESSEGLVAAFAADAKLLAKNCPIFLPCSDLALPTIERGLGHLGAKVDKVVAYRNVSVESSPGLDLSLLDEVVLTSPSTARAFARWFPSPPDRLLLVPIGAATVRALNELFPGRPLGESLLDRIPTEAL
jgi:uroporphyrinogen III methyltransferase/synthase